MSVRGWATGAGSVVVLVATGAWVMWPGNVDGRLWSEVRPVIEARIATEARGSGYGETVPGLDARWFCQAEALGLEARGDTVRADIDTLCVEYGVHGDALVECSAGHVPQVVRLERDEAADGGYRVVSREEAPDGAENARWTRTHFGVLGASALQEPMSTDALEDEARGHFGLPADAAVADC
ncbi:hypothetical protein AQJ84_19140 [Streptomyces resistomycificus]|uniref:Uncharacterized protein n=1 Tax=Streptomyces resistomycificus TaxID=67356 RepID=A0A0L8L7D7_9ACTN|nr:hypothetical protein ADK37_20830 [Streptomyces resistomycificus]KUN96726.1 hypothetical protein AQJ84_19140 [Streptomyces resistomycificus]